MKKFMGIQNRVAKALAVVILSVLSLCCFVLGFSGLTSKLNTTDAAASGLRAWYRFDVASNFGKDYASQAGTYTLTANNSASYEDSYNGMRFLPTTKDSTETKGSLYAASTSADPFYGLTTSSVISVSTILYLGGPLTGGSNFIVTNSNWDANFQIAYTNGNLMVYLGGVVVADWNEPVIPSGEGVYG
ncbi:MAG: hypothetical protein IJY57_01200, partial [Clostridia bacterium]|nr:hypothetical protein [Clostridia bacterium]